MRATRDCSGPRGGLVAGMLLLAVASGCAGDGSRQEPSEVGSFEGPLPSFLSEVPEGMDPTLLAPLAGLGPCDLELDEPVDEQIEGLVLPPDAVVTRVSRQDPLVNVQGYVPFTPIQTRVFFQTRAELEVIQAEDEVREAELLVADGTHRMFLKAQAVCESGSVFIAVIAPEVAADAVPVPTGAATP